MSVTILGVAGALPTQRIPSSQWEEKLSLPPGWTERHVGVREYPQASPEQATSDLSVEAGRKVLEQCCSSRSVAVHPRRPMSDAPGINPDVPVISANDMTLLLLATSTPDHLLPPTAPLVAHRLGLKQAGAVDVMGACAGFLYALGLADAHVRVRGGTAMVIGANVLSRRVDPTDRATAALFTDGAGAVLLRKDEKGGDNGGLLALHLGADGSLYDAITVPSGGTRRPITPERIQAGEHLMRIHQGSTLFREAVRNMANAGKRALESANLTPDDVDWWIPHQGHQRITANAGELLGIPCDRTVNVIAQFGNSSAATIPLALAHMQETNQLRRGQTILMTAVGAGLVSAGAVVRW